MEAMSPEMNFEEQAKLLAQNMEVLQADPNFQEQVMHVAEKMKAKRKAAAEADDPPSPWRPSNPMKSSIFDMTSKFPEHIPDPRIAVRTLHRRGGLPPAEHADARILGQ